MLSYLYYLHSKHQTTQQTTEHHLSSWNLLPLKAVRWHSVNDLHSRDSTPIRGSWCSFSTLRRELSGSYSEARGRDEARLSHCTRAFSQGKSCCCPALSSKPGLMLLTGQVVRGSSGLGFAVLVVHPFEAAYVFSFTLTWFEHSGVCES